LFDFNKLAIQRVKISMSLLEIQNVSKHFGGITAVDHCSFEISEDEGIVGLMGPNGAGKTTLFNIITGFLRPNEGSITYKDKRIDNLQPFEIVKRGLVRSFQITRNLPDLTVLENMCIQSREHNLNSLLKPAIAKDEERRAKELLEFVDLTHLVNEKSRNLSFGQQKLLEFTSALMLSPDTVLLDEPAGGVNPTLMGKIKDYILKLQKEHGINFIIIEHEIDLLMEICSSIVALAQGSVLIKGSPAEVQQNDQVLEAYLGG